MVKKEMGMISSKNTSGNIRNYIETLGDAVDYLKSTISPVGSRNFNSELIMKQEGEVPQYFYGSSFNQALYYAVNGWEAGAKELEKVVGTLVADLMGGMMLDEYYYDVTGQDFDLDRVLIGEPEAWMQTEQYEVKAPAKHTLKLLISVEAMASVGLDAIKTKGAAIAALVIILERMRRFVEIELVGHTRHSSGCIETRTCLKKAGQDLDLGKLAFVLCNGGYLRQMVFAIEERTGTPSQVSRMKNGNYGVSQESGQEDADIYIGSQMGLYSAGSVKTWVLNELKKQGVELKEETI